MKKLITLMILLFCAVSLFAQAQPVTLTFTGRDADSRYLPLTRVIVSNLTKGWQETLLWPDTVLVMSGTGIGDFETFQETSLRLSQNNPNPFDGTTFVNMQVAEPGDVAVEITDITGRIVGANNYSPSQLGNHEMRITLSSAGIYFLTARQNGRTASVKMVNRGNGGGDAVTIAGVVETLRTTSLPHPKNAHCVATGGPFDLGDKMEYVGYAVVNGEELESSHMVQEQNASQTIVLSFPQPCSGAATVTDYDGNVYNTVQIGNQCWMRENLRVMHYSDGTSIPAGGDNYSNSFPYYYDNSNTDIPLADRGYFYNWPAAMRGSNSSSTVPSWVQGVCPNGWHLPSDAEWMVLTDYVSANYACAGDSWNNAKALASTAWWASSSCECCPGDQSETANNASGFGAVPVGYLHNSFYNKGYDARFWSSTGIDNDYDAYRCMLKYNDIHVYHVPDYRGDGFSVRCLRD